jgi:hypothetical protein
MQFNLKSILPTLIVATGVIVASAAELRGHVATTTTTQDRNLEGDDICGGRAVCTNGATCVENTCVCGIGYLPDPTISPISDAGYFSCVQKNECLADVNPCAAENSVCIDADPPRLFKCSCTKGENNNPWSFLLACCVSDVAVLQCVEVLASFSSSIVASSIAGSSPVAASMPLPCLEYQRNKSNSCTFLNKVARSH